MGRSGHLGQRPGYSVDDHPVYSSRGYEHSINDYLGHSGQGRKDSIDQHRSIDYETRCRVAPVVDEDQRPPHYPWTTPSQALSQGIESSTLTPSFDHHVTSPFGRLR